MFIYKCSNCNDLECETSICPVCNQRTVLQKTRIFWSNEFNCPSFDEICKENNEKCTFIGSDIRPVFPEERLLLEILIKEPFKYAGASIWNINANTYVINGKKITFKFGKLIKENDSEKVIEELKKNYEENLKYEEDYMKSDYIYNFIKINKYRFKQIKDEAIHYIKEKTYGFGLDEMFVSFSGGKDSTVTSDLVMKALSTKTILHIYGDTTLEYPSSSVYLKRFKKENPTTPVLIAKNSDQDFNNLCEVIGPPSRVMRWCCTVFKTGAITKKIERTFAEQRRILSFQGIRRNESKSRSKYERESMSPKITKQKVVSPIIDWLDFDVWLYILSDELDFNDAYKQGFSRVGCWCCPNNSDWSAFLSSIYMHEEYIKFRDILYKFAQKVGKDDWKDYIDDGKWKARQGGNGLEISETAVVSFKPCALEENAYNFELTRPIDDFLYTLFKPFGILDFNIGNKRLNEVYVLHKKTKEPILKLSGRKGNTKLKITILGKLPAFKSLQTTESLIKCQITKFQTCLACGGCQSVCRHNALKVMNLEKGSVSNETIHYAIDAEKCIGCLECVNHFDNGCYMKKVLRIKKR